MLLSRFPSSPRLSPAWLLLWGKVENQPVGCTYFLPGKLAVMHTQPAFSPQQGYAVVGDGWLTNRSQLLQHLGVTNDSPLTDQHLIAWLWEKQGSKCIEQLEGNFSFCVWEIESNCLWLIRDRIGAYPLYYTENHGTVTVAPRLKTLSPFHGKELDLIALRDYLITAFVPGERTLWQNVHQLAPGTILSLPERTFKRYWTPEQQVKHSEQSLEWHSYQLRSLLDQVMGEYLPKQEPVGVYLSGGLDSSCITALAAKFHSEPVHTYSIHFGADCPNELAYSGLVADYCHTQHHILEITPKLMWEQLPLVMGHLDNPIGDPLTVPNYLLAELAKQQVRVILNGEGGDPCFGGPKNQPMLLNQLYGTTTDLLSAYLTSFQKCFTDLPRLLKPQVWEMVKDQPYVFTDDLFSQVEYINRLMTLNIKYKGVNHILTKVYNLTRSANLEGRSPLFDQRVVQLSLEIPPEYKLMGAIEKAVLKSAVRDILPFEIIQRPKSGMMVPVQLWFKKYWNRQARRLLLSHQAKISPYLEQKVMQDWLNYQGDIWGRYGVKLWLLVSLELWLQMNR